jgi:hypothetical protein
MLRVVLYNNQGRYIQTNFIIKIERDILNWDKTHRGGIELYQSITWEGIVQERFGCLGASRKGSLMRQPSYAEFYADFKFFDADLNKCP